MLPPTAASDIPSEAERYMFGVIREGLSDDWAALHSLGLGSHATKPWAEIDFALVGPAGIYCLEVKGGRVSRQAGRWVFTNRRGIESTRREGPFEQAAGAASALAAYLRESRRDLLGAPVGYGVVFPDIEFGAEGPDIEPLVVYDARDTALPFLRYVDRLSSYWRGHLEAKTRRPYSALTASEISGAVDLLRGDFDARLSLRATARGINRELLRLTTEQYRVLDALAENERVLVTGAAGTGKTLLAVEEARRSGDLGRRVLVVCLSPHLASYLRERLAPYTNVVATTLPTFIEDIVTASGRSGDLPNAAEADLTAVFRPRLCRDVLTAAGEAPFDVLIVDEAQDLMTDAYLSVLDAAVAGGLRAGVWRIFFDPLQNVFDGIGSDPLRGLRSSGPATFRLVVNCRNTAPIATATSLLADVACDQVLQAEGPEVNYIWYAHAAERRKHLIAEIKRLLEGGMTVEDVVVLSRTGEMAAEANEMAARACREAGCTTVVRCETIANFKGLEADAILVYAVEELDTPAADRLMYVASSRARAFLSIMLDLRTKMAYGALASKLGRRLRPGTA